jgi:predicted HicB family RNase H-like nuclease
MSKKPIQTHAMTIRIEESLDAALTEQCWASRVSKARWIRAALRQYQTSTTK